MHLHRHRASIFPRPATMLVFYFPSLCSTALTTVPGIAATRTERPRSAVDNTRLRRRLRLLDVMVKRGVKLASWFVTQPFITDFPKYWYPKVSTFSSKVIVKYLSGAGSWELSLDEVSSKNVYVSENCDATVLITSASVRLQNALFVTTHDLVTSRKKIVTTLQCWSHNG